MLAVAFQPLRHAPLPAPPPVRAIAVTLAPPIEAPAPKLLPSARPVRPEPAPPRRAAAKASAAPLPVPLPTTAAQEAVATAATEPPAPSAPSVSPPQTIVESAQSVTEDRPRYAVGSKDNPAPAYPRASRQLREQGEVLIAVYVDTEGLPAKIELRRGSGHARLDQAALEAVRRWRFDPVRKGGSALAAWVEVPIRFTLEA